MSSFKLNLHQTYKGTIVQHLKMFWCNCWCKIWTNLKICTWGWSLLWSINTVPFFFLLLFVIWNSYDLSFVSDAIAGDDNIRLAPSIRSKRGQWWSFNNVFLSNFFCFVFYLTRWIIVWKVISITCIFYPNNMLLSNIHFKWLEWKWNRFRIV